jgi:hypothetical protein
LAPEKLGAFIYIRFDFNHSELSAGTFHLKLQPFRVNTLCGFSFGGHKSGHMKTACFIHPAETEQLCFYPKENMESITSTIKTGYQ